MSLIKRFRAAGVWPSPAGEGVRLLSGFKWLVTSYVLGLLALQSSGLSEKLFNTSRLFPFPWERVRERAWRILSNRFPSGRRLALPRGGGSAVAVGYKWLVTPCVWVKYQACLKNVFRQASVFIFISKPGKEHPLSPGLARASFCLKRNSRYSGQARV